MYIGIYSAIVRSLSWGGQSSTLWGHYREHAKDMGWQTTFANFNRTRADVPHRFFADRIGNTSFLLHGWLGEELEARKKTHIVFPLPPGGFVMWALSSFGRERFLRWYLANTEISDVDGTPLPFENEGWKIRNARTLFNLILVISHGGWLRTEYYRLPPESLLRKYAPEP